MSRDAAEAGGVLIVGAGLAGVTAALWCRRVDLRFRWIEAGPDLGGQLARINGPIPDYPGRWAPDGRSFRDALVGQLEAEGLGPELGVALAMVGGEAGAVGLSTGEHLRVRAVLLCTGAGPRRLGVPGEESLRGLGVSDSATRDRERLRGLTVAVVGGGDAALENALILAEACPHVVLLHRGAAFKGRASFQAAVRAHPRIEVRLGVTVAEVLGKERVTGLVLDTPRGPEELAVEAVVVKVGVAPQLGPFSGRLVTDPSGYVSVDAEQRTSSGWVWAAGDVCNPLASSLTVAAGQATVAVKAIERFLGETDGMSPAG